MRIAIANFSRTARKHRRLLPYWSRQTRPPRPARRETLFEYEVGWGFHIFAMGTHALDRGLADEVEFWSCGEENAMAYMANGILRVRFLNPADARGYIRHFGAPDLFINYGVMGHAILPFLKGKSFRVHIPCLRVQAARPENHDAECYLVDDERFLDDRSMLYVPVVNTEKIRPAPVAKVRDFLYLANVRPGKRHDILLDAVRGTELTGHLHPVNPGELDLRDTRITTSTWGETNLLELMQTSRIAVSPGDYTSNPAAMWESVAAGMPIVVNEDIQGGRHLVAPGVTGELAAAGSFGEVMKNVLAHREDYRPREYFMEHWDTVKTIERYFDFFREMGWEGAPCS